MRDEVWWAQRSRASWLQYGDKNTKFFHQKVTQRRDKNWVDRIQDDEGRWYEEEEDIAHVMTTFFQELFMRSEMIGEEEAASVVKGRVANNMRTILSTFAVKKFSAL